MARRTGTIGGEFSRESVHSKSDWFAREASIRTTHSGVAECGGHLGFAEPGKNGRVGAEKKCVVRVNQVCDHALRPQVDRDAPVSRRAVSSRRCSDRVRGAAKDRK